MKRTTSDWPGGANSWQERSAETVRRLPGFVSAYAVRLADEQLTFVTAFVDETTAEKGKEASIAWVSQRLMDLDVEFQDALEGEVVSHAGAA